MINPDPKVKSTDEAAPKLTAEQAALLAGAGMVDQTISGGIEHDGQGNLLPPADAEPKIDKVQQNTDMLAMLIGMALPALPFLKDCYTPQVIGNIAAAYTQVEEKYGWDASGMIGPEVTLALFVIPPSITAYTLGKAHFAELRAKREQEQARKPQIQAQGDARDNIMGSN